MNAFAQLNVALAAQGAQVSFVPGASHTTHNKTKRSRDFAETIAHDVYEHLQTKPDVKDRLHKLLSSNVDVASKVKAVRPLVAHAAESLFKLASSGEHKFDAIFPSATLDAVAKHLVAQAS